MVSGDGVRLRRVSLALLAAGLLGVLLVTSNAALATSATAPGDSIIEEVRTQVLDNGLVVEHRVLIDRTLTDDPAAVADEVTGISRDTEPAFSAQYKRNPWKWSPEQIPVPVYYNPAGGSAGLPDALPWIQSALQAWSGVTTSFAFTYDGTTDAGFGACSYPEKPDGRNTIGFTRALPRGILGQTCTLADRGTGAMIEFDIQLSNSTNWAADNPTKKPYYDLPSTLLHELGHGTGLADLCDPRSTVTCSPAERSAVMYYSLAQGVNKRSLTEDDIDGLLAQYPGGTVLPRPTPTPTPTPIPTPTPPGIPPYERNFERILAGVSRD